MIRQSTEPMRVATADAEQEGPPTPEAATSTTELPELEICCVCFFVHKDQSARVRGHKLHYHWRPALPDVDAITPIAWVDGTDVTLLPTVCATCVPATVLTALGVSAIAAWAAARQRTPLRYTTTRLGSSANRYNASFEAYPELDGAYAALRKNVLRVTATQGVP